MRTYIEKVFSAIFNDNEWFNKILVGGLYILLVPFLIGIVMVNGYMILFMRSLSQSGYGLPYWRNFRLILRTGWRVSAALVIYYGIATVIAQQFGIGLFSGEMAVLYAMLHCTIHPVVLFMYSHTMTFRSCFSLSSLRAVSEKSFEFLKVVFVAAVGMLASLFLGWMWIVVGWPLLIFLAFALQNGLIAVVHVHHFSSHSS